MLIVIIAIISGGCWFVLKAIGGQAVMLIAMQCVFATCLQANKMLGGQFADHTTR